MSLASDNLEFIYVRVPRSGSTTFSQRMSEEFPDDLVDLGGPHPTASALEKMWGDKWNTYVTFGFVRNPWDWLVSVYNSGTAIGNWPGNRIDTPDSLPGQRDNYTFDEWARTAPFQRDWLEGVDRIYRMEDFMQGESLKRNAVKHAPYQSWYTEDLKNHVGARYWWEIKEGNYEFG